ncbi:hypothetical protein MATL_G00167520 [Megalops atlanticus]|uniref:Uncharacterized protein n=1 Tax=Megalops atlanticus TaxID=7932 RepID=A0A9D3T7Q8_MEGAT|nr:hypothetical protein MATL_G00167520 [Megalops atlanticus]
MGFPARRYKEFPPSPASPHHHPDTVIVEAPAQPRLPLPKRLFAVWGFWGWDCPPRFSSLLAGVRVGSWSHLSDAAS